MFSDVEQKLKKKNKILFSRDSEAWAKGKIKRPAAQRAILDAHAVAKEEYQEPVRKKIDYYVRRLIYWQENIDEVDLEWASFLLADNRPNKEGR